MTWNHDTLHDKTAAYTLSDKKKSHVNRVNSSGSVKLRLSKNLTFPSEDGVYVARSLVGKWRRTNEIHPSLRTHPLVESQLSLFRNASRKKFFFWQYFFRTTVTMSVDTIAESVKTITESVGPIESFAYI